ncbi:MAG: LLM class flavin-dependent oxidoreductase [Gammaproteobacteria bacterium]|nr:LLM class flavin-dependent oxidoreductase [Gammaproteobacteria bacterium]
MKVGLLFNTDPLPGSALGSFARDAEQAGFDRLWVPELFGREPFVTAGALLHATSTIGVATGIANVYVRDAMATKAAAATLAELSGGRFELGLGVSNTVGNTLRGHEWLPPVAKLAAFFDALEAAQLSFKSAPVPVYVAAHGPRLMAFAAARADGAMTYLATAAYNAAARKSLGANQQLIVVQPTLINDSAEHARRIGRKAVSVYMPLANYHRAWLAQGWARSDFADGGSDRFIDALINWGSVSAVRARLAQHAAAGVDQVVLIPLNVDALRRPDLGLLAQAIR